MKECGFLPVSGGSPGVFYHPTLGAEMVVYVDDSILISPENMELSFGKTLISTSNLKTPQLQ